MKTHLSAATQRHRQLARIAILLALLLGVAAFLAWPAAVPPLAGSGKINSASKVACPDCAPQAAENLAAVRTVEQPVLFGASSALPPNPAFDDFNAWAARYVAAAPAERLALEAEGVRLAEPRRAALKKMIVAEPNAALARALSFTQQQALPVSVRARTEERVSVDGTLRTAISYTPGKPSETQHRVETDDRNWRAFTQAKRFAKWTPNQTVPLHGVAVDDVLALSNDAVRMAEPGEIPEATLVELKKTATCPVSGNPVAALVGAVPALVGSRAIYLCSGGHIEVLNEELIAGAGTGTTGTGADGATANSAYTEVPKSLLFIRVKFSDQTSDPQTYDDVVAKMLLVSDFLSMCSYGKTSISSTVVTPVYTLPGTTAEYVTWGDGKLRTDALNLAKNDTSGPYNHANYGLDVVRWNGGPGQYGGQAYVGAKGCWMKTSSAGTTAHEFGHNYGLWHANYWQTTDGTTIGAGSNQEYGNSFDVMGNSGSFPHGHYNAYEKNVLDWIPDGQVRTITASGNYRVYAHDLNTITAGRMYGLKVRKDTDRDYWMEYRQHSTWAGSKQYMFNSVTLQWDAWASSNGGSQLLDTTPGSAAGKDDAAIALGRTFSDTATGLHFTLTNRGGTGTDLYADVQVNFGTFPGNQAPTLTLTASNLTPQLNEAVSFTATASDPDNDTLAYHWDFGDKTYAPNAAASSKTWTTAGARTVTCIVSDMKGQSITQTLSINVMNKPTIAVSASDNASTEAAGNNGTFTFTRSVNSTVPVTVKYSMGGTATNGTDYTNVTGTVTLAASVNTATVTIAPTEDTLPEGTETAVLTLTADAAYNTTGTLTQTVNITDNDPLPVLTVETATSTINEAVGTHSFNLKLTTASPLAVSVTVARTGGTGTTADATLPAGTVTFNPGETLKAVTLNVVDDTIDEVNETYTLTISAPVRATLGTQKTHTVTINDNDLPPEVAFASPTPGGPENAPTLTIPVQLSSASSFAITVAYEFTAQTADATDATLTGGTLNFPAGSTSADIVLALLDDTVLEGNETLLVTLSSPVNASLGAQNPATVTIQDDDGPKMTSQLVATPNPASATLPVSFSASASMDGLSWSWNFADGSPDMAGSNSTQHTFATAGTYTVTVTATHSNGLSATSTVAVTVMDLNDGGNTVDTDGDGHSDSNETTGGTNPANPTSFPGGPGDFDGDGIPDDLDTDDDGDGVSDGNEVSDGTNPYDPDSVKLNPLKVTKAKGGVKFGAENGDSLSFSGLLENMPAGFDTTGKVVLINAGGVKGSITLDAKGKGRNAFGSLALKMKKSRDKVTKVSSFLGGSVAFSVKLNKGTFSDNWSAAGFTSETAKKKPLNLDLRMALDGRAYGTMVPVLWTASSKGGALKR